MQKPRAVNEKSIGGGSHLQDGAWQTGAGRGEGIERNPQSGPASEDELRGERMSGEEAARYRAMAAQCNFLGCDRPDIQHMAKEASRCMSRHCQGDQGKTIRTGKYLNGGFRRVVQMRWFGRDDGVTSACSDSDCAGCLRARKSTSGGVFVKWVVWSSMVKHWPPSQKAIALSSAEPSLDGRRHAGT